MELYQISIEKLAESLETCLKTGLTKIEAHKRALQSGANKVKKKIGRSFLRIFLEQFHDPMIYLLLGSGGIIFFAGEVFDAYIIAGIILLNTVIGTFQEMRIAVVLERLQSFNESHALVIRDGERHLISVTQLVKGDLIIVQQGEYIPADARIVEASNLSVDQSMLTGESDPVIKLETTFEKLVSVNEQTNMLFMGSYVLSGYAHAVVVAIGKETQLGEIHQTIETSSSEMPLQKDLSSLLQFILGVIVVICFALLAIGVVTGKPFGQLLAALTALFICVVPQGLPVIMTLALVSGAYRMARQKVFAKRLQAVEALGRADVIVLDKTGTLTRNEMMATKVIAGDNEYAATGFGYQEKGQVTCGEKQVTFQNSSDALQLMATTVVLLNRSEVSYSKKVKTFSIKGNPSQAAMYIFAKKLGVNEPELLKEYKTEYEIPFNVEHQYHEGLFKRGSELITLLTGAPETVIKRCVKITEFQEKKLAKLLQEGLRVIAVAQKKETEKEFTLLGFYGLSDTLRKEAPGIIKTMQKAGIHVVMATGDNEQTAMHLAKEAHILKEGGAVINGSDFKEKSNIQLLQDIKQVKVFSRMLPEDKVRLIDLFKQQGNTVAMIGDGVNDAPALTVAHLGVAMGTTGSDVAKQAADIILLDSSFKSVIVGIEQGRHIFMSFKRVTLYFFTTNFSEVTIMLLALGMNFPLPFLASQILWLNLVTDGFLDCALAMEPREPGLLRADWLQDSPQLITRALVLRIIYQAMVVALISLTVFYYHYKADLVFARTMTLATMTTCQWVMAINCRSFHRSITQIGIASNRWLFAALAIIPVLFFGVLYTSWGQNLFKVVPLSFTNWQFILAIGVVLLLVEELRKWLAGSAR